MRKNTKNDHVIPVVPKRVQEYVRSKQGLVSAKALSKEFSFSLVTALNYLSRLQKAGVIHRVAPNQYVLSKESVKLARFDEKEEKISRAIEKELPLARFTVWSTRDLNAYYHNVPQRHFYLVETEPETAVPVSETLRASGFNPVLLDSKESALLARDLIAEPVFILKKREVVGLHLEGKRLRPTMERILVDLYFLLSRRKIDFPLQELGRVFRNILRKERLNFALLLTLARRRNTAKEWREILYRLKQNSSFSLIPSKYAVKQKLAPELGKNVFDFVESSE